MRLALQGIPQEASPEVGPRGRFLDITEAAYHADPGEVPSLSSSVAKTLIQRSPLHAWQQHPRLGGAGAGRQDTDATTDGTLIHALLLGKGMDKIAVLDVDDFRTKAAKEAREAARAKGLTVVKQADFAAANEVAACLRERIAGYGIKLDGRSEEKMEWIETTEDGAEVLCRGMVDHLKISFDGVPRAEIFDVKSIRSADKKSINRAIESYGYDLQSSAYTSGVGHVVPECQGRIDFLFLFVELEAPYAVTPVRLDGGWRMAGEMKWQHAVRTWGRCLNAGTEAKHWPAYTDSYLTAEVPPWVLSETLSSEASNDADV